jgi:CRISPR-associated protein Cas2
MDLLVAYDVSTETPEGRRRLRRVAQTCQAYGQRVQKSVFECSVNAVQREQLLHRLLQVIDPTEDSLRVYQLSQPRELHLLVFGTEPEFDLGEPLVL